MTRYYIKVIVKDLPLYKQGGRDHGDNGPHPTVKDLSE